MRIITGIYRGRKLESPVGRDVRPTSDKVKEAMFNILQMEITDAVVIDLFAGTGNLGLEALSRGAEKCYFCDSSRESINLVKTNVAKCGAEKEAVILAGDFTKTLARINEQADIILLDPPYKAGLYEGCLQQIDGLDLLKEDGIILAEHGSRDVMPEEVAGFVKTRTRKYGTMSVSIYKHKVEEES